MTLARKAWLHNDRMSAFPGTSLGVPRIFLPLGFLLLALQSLSNMAGTLRKSPSSPAQHLFGEQPEVERQI